MRDNENKDLKTISLEISGMTCSGCSSHIEKDMNKTNGIVSSNVNHETGKGEFTFDTNKMGKEELINAVNSIGNYSVVNGIEKEDSFSSTSDTTISKESNKNKNQFDLIVIGGGSAAFSAAIKAEGLGLTTLMVNAGLEFGGTCVNVGCVPSKNLIRAAETAYHATHSNFKGIKPRGVDIDFKQIIKDKKELVSALQQQKYMDVVSDFENLTMLKGWAEFVDKNTIIVNGKDKYSATNIVIATGATTNIPNIEGLNKVGYLTNVSLFDLEEKPISLTIMGAGYIGLEIAQAYSRLGVKVRIIEFTDRPLRTQTSDITDVLVEQMKSEGIEILPNFRASKFEKKGNDIINLTKSGHILVNEKMETNVSNIYAAGDVTNTPPFVYTAATEGNTAVNNAFSLSKSSIDYSSLPWVVFTDPQIAGAGMDEIEAEAKGIPFEVSKLDLKHVPRALAAQDTRGFIKLIRNTETDKLIGARVIAPEGGELIQQLSMAIKFGITVKDLAESFYPYLTLGEGIKLAAITFGKDVSKLSCCAS